MRPLTWEEQRKYGSERIVNDAPEAPHFLSENARIAEAELSTLVTTQFDQYDSTHAALTTLGVVAEFDDRSVVRRAAARALDIVVTDHTPHLRIRSAVMTVERAATTEASREHTDAETLRLLMGARTKIKAYQQRLPITFRPATTDDARAMAELATKEISGNADDITWRTDLFRRGIESGAAVALVAQLEDRTVGMAFTTIDERAGSTLEFLAVAKQYSRCGIGGRLLDQSMRDARDRGAGEMQLRAFGDMTQDYYRAFGFTGPRDELLITMHRSLDATSPEPLLARGGR